MSEMWMDVDTALSEVPINLFPLIDDTDFKSREESVTYDQSGLDLVWCFTTTAGATTQTAVTPTDTGGNYDFVNQGNGMYTIEIPASGGASINNDTEGFGYFVGYATGILPWRGPVIGFRAVGLNNVLIDSAYSATRGLAGTALPDAVADAAGGLVISDAGGLDIDASAATIDNIETDTQDIQTQVGTAGAGLTNINLPDQVMNVTGTWTGNIAGNLTGSVGSVASVGTIGDAGVSLSSIPWNAAWDAEVQSEVTDALVAHNLDHLALTATSGADMTTEVADNTILSRIIANGDTSAFDPSTDGLQPLKDSLATAAEIRTEIDSNSTQLASIVADTGELQTDWTNGGRLDLIVDSILADTNELQGDWVNAGRLDTILDSVLADTNELQGDWTNTGRLDTIIDSILADTNELQTDDTPAAIAALNNVSAGDVETAAGAAIVTYHLDHLLATAYDATSKPGNAAALLNEMVEDDGGVTRYTVNALENAPSGTGASAATIADAVWDEAQADHVGAGTFGEVATETAAILSDTETDGVAIADGYITAAKIGADAITNAKIADDAIAVENIKDAAITAAKIGADAITNAKIADNAIAAEHIADGAIDAATFAANAITSTVVADNTITAAKIAASAITATKINAGAITSAKFAAGAIDAAAIAANAIGSSELDSSAVNEIVDQVWDELQSAHVTAGSFGAIAADLDTIMGSEGLTAYPYAFEKNVAVTALPFYITDSTNHLAATSKTVTVQISKDGAAFGDAGDTPATEIGSGWYQIDLTQAEMNANHIILKMTASGCDQVGMFLRTES